MFVAKAHDGVTLRTVARRFMRVSDWLLLAFAVGLTLLAVVMLGDLI